METEKDCTLAESHCYCKTTEKDECMLSCSVCKKSFHTGCLKSGPPSPLAGDVYFIFTCENCSRNGQEVVNRKKMNWTLVIMLALFNLQVQREKGKCGYFRWREHICQFIDKNWVHFWGDRKKSATWYGTVAGSLSINQNRFFKNGMEVLGENGWWSLMSSKLPSMEELDKIIMNVKRKRQTEDITTFVEGPRRKTSNVVEAAVALKEKKMPASGEAKTPKTKRKKSEKSDDFPYKHKLKIVVAQSDYASTSQDQGIPKIIIKKEKEELPNFDLWIKEPELDINLDVDPTLHDGIFDLPDGQDSLFDVFPEPPEETKSNFKQEFESDNENSNSSLTVGASKKLHPDTSRKRKAVTKDESPVKELVAAEPKFTLMSPYDEEQLLLKLQSFPIAMNERPEVRRLYRKLMVRQVKRERNLPVFNIDAEMRSFRGMDPPEYMEKENLSMPTPIVPSFNSILDRYQTSGRSRSHSLQHASFVTRLMGIEDEDQESIVSPYTERILKPFIFRDFKTKPLKLRLLQELLQRTHPDGRTPKQSSIDYCYVRPQHIPGINALCQEFFWPGIDMSESLQYPDFSCVALYKKVIIGFSFMVPDVKYNEAYITFIFCHPEWRRAGIATFMLYHLIQTCMGKDVTLHVSSTSSAVFLYQKFGFKVEELIQDFYDKYLPTESKECRHALFFRLSR